MHQLSPFQLVEVSGGIVDDVLLVSAAMGSHAVAYTASALMAGGPKFQLGMQSLEISWITPVFADIVVGRCLGGQTAGWGPDSLSTRLTLVSVVAGIQGMIKGANDAASVAQPQ